MRASHSLDRVGVTFDDDHAVADAGLFLTATTAQHLGLEQILNGTIDLADRPDFFRPGRKAMTLIHSLVAGGDCIDDADVLRCGSTADVLGHRVMAPSTLGTLLRSFTFGNVRQLDRASELALTAAWAAGAGPGNAELTIDIDSSICEVYGYQKQGPPTATPTSSATTPCSPPGPTPAKSSTAANAKDQPTPPAAPNVSSARRSAEPAGPAPPARS